MLDSNSFSGFSIKPLLYLLLTPAWWVSGGTASGKTTMLNSLSSFIPDSERIVVIEDSQELQLLQDHVVLLEARPPDSRGRGAVTIRDLFKATLRMRPDRIVVGEIRGGEALDVVQAMTSGHAGGLATVHATYPVDTINRMETMSMMRPRRNCATSSRGPFPRNSSTRSRG